MAAALIEPLREIYGVSDKVLAMALSSLLLGAPKKMGLWIEVGGSMIAIDTLVHNFLHRTGILARFNANHPYGAGCYRPGGCADIIAAVAERIDARQFNPAFRRPFLGSSSTRSGGTAPGMGSTSATAIGSMMPNDVPTWTAKRGSCVIGSCCAGLWKTEQSPHDHALAPTSRSSATGSIANSPGGIPPPLTIRAFGAHCHFRTNAVQQRTSLFDHFVGSDKHASWYSKPERPRSLEVDE